MNEKFFTKDDAIRKSMKKGSNLEYVDTYSFELLDEENERC